MTPTILHTKPISFTSDAEYIEALGRALHSRAMLIGARLQAKRDAEDEGQGLTVVDDAGVPPQAREKIARLEAADETVWATIDARRAATVAQGRLLGLDDLCARHQLDDLGKLTIAITVLPAIGMAWADAFSTLGNYGCSLYSASPELVAVVAGLDMAGRLRFFQQLSGGKLGGLVELDWRGDDCPADIWTSSLQLSRAAFDHIFGLSHGKTTACSTCGQPVPKDETA